MNLLLVDDVESNLGILEMNIEEWFDEKQVIDTKYKIDFAYNGQEALNAMKTTQYDIVFLDIMMPVMDGLEALKIIRETLKYQPKIIVQTALNDTKIKQKAKSLGANAYITKPINFNMIDVMLNRYVDLKTLTDSNDNTTQQIETEEFDEFLDFDDFDDFDDFSTDEINTQKSMMDSFNASHKKIPASVFLEDCPNIQYILEDLDVLEYEMSVIIETLGGINLEDNITKLENIFNNYSRFLNTFVDFYELATSLSLLTELLNKIVFDKLNNTDRDFIAKFIVAILDDLQNWKEHVFVEQDAIDVFYINASALNSCIQLAAYIKNHTKG